ncbi:hypothetical protein, partial [Serratia marcescens]
RDVYAVLVSRDVQALADVSLTTEAGRAILPDNAWQKTTRCRYRANLPIGAFDDDAVCYLETVATVSTAR